MFRFDIGLMVDINSVKSGFYFHCIFDGDFLLASIINNSISQLFNEIGNNLIKKYLIIGYSIIHCFALFCINVPNLYLIFV